VRLGFGGEDTLLGPEGTSVVSSGAFLILVIKLSTVVGVWWRGG
jgi:hypothetical protein